MRRLLLGPAMMAHTALLARHLEVPLAGPLLLLHDTADPALLRAAAQKLQAPEVLVIPPPAQRSLPILPRPESAAASLVLLQGILPRRYRRRPDPFWATLDRPGTRQRKRRQAERRRSR